MEEQICYRPIGIIHSPYPEPYGVPFQPSFGRGVEGTVEVFPEYAEGLADLDGFSHITLIYHLHRAQGYRLRVTPPHRRGTRGLFATRAPHRPNPIGVSTVRLLKVEGRILHIADLDIIDGTPLLDIKPYVLLFIKPGAVKNGWVEERHERSVDEEGNCVD